MGSRRQVVVVVALALSAGCARTAAPTAPPAEPSATAPPSAAGPGAVTLALRVETEVPGADLMATLMDTRAEEPRAEFPGGFAERVPAKALLKLRRGQTIEVVQWSVGRNQWRGTTIELSMRDREVTLAKVE